MSKRTKAEILVATIDGTVIYKIGPWILTVKWLREKLRVRDEAG